MRIAASMPVMPSMITSLIRKSGREFAGCFNGCFSRVHSSSFETAAVENKGERVCNELLVVEDEDAPENLCTRHRIPFSGCAP